MMKNTISMNVSAIGTDDGKSTFEVQRTWNEKGKNPQEQYQYTEDRQIGSVLYYTFLPRFRMVNPFFTAR